MALVQQPWMLSVTLVDRKGGKSVMRYTLQPRADLAGYEAAAAAVVAALGAVTESAISDYALVRQFSEDALVLPTNQQLNTAYALVSQRIDTTVEKYGSIRFPNPIPGIFVASSGKSAGVIDPADPDLAAYIALFENGAEVSFSDGEFALPASPGNTSGKLVFRGGPVA